VHHYFLRRFLSYIYSSFVDVVVVSISLSFLLLLYCAFVLYMHKTNATGAGILRSNDFGHCP
jgi:hypothetical protein